MNDVDRVLVVHVQRTAGTALRQAIETAHGTGSVHPSAELLAARPGGRYEPAAELLERWSEVPPHRFLFGHYLAALVDVLPVPYRTATFLREPVARSVSIVEHHALQTGRAVSDLLTDETFLASHITDLQTRVFGTEIPAVGGVPQVVRPQEASPAVDSTLERAVSRLRSFDFVGLSDEFAVSVRRFDSVFATSISRRVAKVNSSVRGDTPRVEIEETIRPLVRRDVELLATLFPDARASSSLR